MTQHPEQTAETEEQMQQIVDGVADQLPHNFECDDIEAVVRATLTILAARSKDRSQDAVVALQKIALGEVEGDPNNPHSLFMGARKLALEALATVTTVEGMGE